MKTLAEYIQKYHLPSEDELVKEHGVIHVEEDEDVLVKLIKELREKIAKYTSFLYHLMQPESDITEMIEANQFSEAERERIYQLYTQLVAKHREYYLVFLTYSSQDNAKYYNELFALWSKHKEEVRSIVTQALSAWQHTTLKEAKQSYLG